MRYAKIQNGWTINIDVDVRKHITSFEPEMAFSLYTILPHPYFVSLKAKHMTA